ncbi:hypothetical protein BDQ12DRAFT_681233 [Crucibulum laeve]|uniref:Uncharacterized protein n=1 Tax=Crucibulum laeve TaxID=68775 RepID=A0A5C3M4Z6_9AGAR|nr:hypothetical protein BDQ12DRAFT_681233 [Crucibulum laeve]
MALTSAREPSNVEWAALDLARYNVAIQPEEPQSFFRRPIKALDHLDKSFLSPEPPHPHCPATDFFRSLGVLESEIEKGNLSAVAEDNIAEYLLRLLGIESSLALSHLHYRIPIQMKERENVAVQTTASIIDVVHGLILLVAQADMRATGVDLRPSLVAAAVAAYQQNNASRVKLGLDPLDVMVIPCIRMHGTCLHFYKVPVSSMLNEVVRMGTQPSQLTIVSYCAPEIPKVHNTLQMRMAMKDVEYRKRAFEYLSTFKETAEDYWKRYSLLQVDESGRK